MSCDAAPLKENPFMQEDSPTKPKLSYEERLLLGKKAANPHVWITGGDVWAARVAGHQPQRPTAGVGELEQVGYAEEAVIHARGHGQRVRADALAARVGDVGQNSARRGCRCAINEAAREWYR